MSRVAVVQLVSSSHVEKNLKETEQQFIVASDLGAQLIVLPENFAFMSMKENDKYRVAETFQQGPIQEAVASLARKYKLWVIAGTILIKSPSGRLYASSIVYDEQGKVCARYNKIHLFDVRVSKTEAHQESATIEPGHDVVVCDTPIGKVGLTVCYDLRFPELYQLLLNKGAEIFSVPSAFTAITGKAHWKTLLRARAIENLCYVLAANQGGKHENGRETYGYSMIIDPWGKLIGEHPQGNGLVAADLDLNYLKQLRTQFP